MDSERRLARTTASDHLDDEALLAHVDRLRRRERALSDRRPVLLAHLDRLQAALVDRYRDGRVVIDEAFTLDSS